MPPTNNGSTEDVPPPVVPIVHHESISKPANAPVSASRPNQKASSPCPFEEEFDERTKSFAQSLNRSDIAGRLLKNDGKVPISFMNLPDELNTRTCHHHIRICNFWEGDDKLPVIIAKDLKNEEKAALIEVLKSHKRAIAWKLSDIKGINPEFCTHKILMEEDYEPTVQHQRRVNPKIHDVIKKEVEKLLDAGLIYPISDSPWGGEERSEGRPERGRRGARRMPRSGDERTSARVKGHERAYNDGVRRAEEEEKRDIGREKRMPKNTSDTFIVVG
ncbi:hypothetical protein Tco_0643633 [Tanacetum coccineum]